MNVIRTIRAWSRSKPRKVLSSRRRGMSLVEVMVVIAIILTLMSILMLGVFRAYNNSKVETTKLTMTKVNQEVELFILRKKKPPTTADGLAEAFDGDTVPKDSWNNEFVYVSPGPGGEPYDLVSLGSDGQEGGNGTAADLKWSEMRKE